MSGTGRKEENALCAYVLLFTLLQSTRREDAGQEAGLLSAASFVHACIGHAESCFRPGQACVRGCCSCNRSMCHRLSRKISFNAGIFPERLPRGWRSVQSLKVFQTVIFSRNRTSPQRPKVQKRQFQGVTRTLKRAKSTNSDIYLPYLKSLHLHRGQWDSGAAVKNPRNLFPSKATRPYWYRIAAQPGSAQLATRLESF